MTEKTQTHAAPSSQPLPATLDECRAALARAGGEDSALQRRLAELLLRAGQRREAAEWYLKAGAGRYAQGQRDEALTCWEAALAAHPGYVPALMNTGKIYREQGRDSQAIARYRQALEQDPACWPAYGWLAMLYFKHGEMEQAEEISLKRLALRPDAPEAVEGLAQVLERQGRTQEAYTLLQPHLTAHPDHPGVARVFAVVCQHLKPPQAEAVPLLERQLAKADLSAADRKQTLMALAKLCDALERPAAAFAYLQQAKALLPPEDPQGKRAIAHKMIAEAALDYTSERLARLPRAAHGSELPVFVVGMPRSGTTLIEHILAQHPRVYGAGELKYLAKLAVEGLGKQPYPQCLDALTPHKVEALAAGYLRHLRGFSAEASRVVDKMPFNFMHLGLIQTLFPRARIIHCLRHPLDTCTSIYFNEIHNMSDNANLTMLGGYYRRYWEMMQYWRRVLDIPIYTMRYEALVTEPERHIRELVAFCGLEWDDACLDFHASQRHVATISYYQVRQPIYTSSVGRYQAYEPFLAPLKAALGDSLEQVCQELQAK